MLSSLTLSRCGLVLSLTVAALCKADDGVLPAPGATTPSSAVARLRIPSQIIVNAVNREFRNTLPVDREVLGTRSRGMAVCVGTVTCSLNDNPHGAEFECLISGTVTSTTCGVNGPATINSSASTKYIARKVLFFDGRQITTTPAEVKVHTQLQITNIGSSLPRLRGRVVRRVANRRAAESREQAEAITSRLTHNDLQQQIDAEFDNRISALNQRLAKRLDVVDLLAQVRHQVAIRTQADSIVLDLYEDSAANSIQFPTASLEVGDSIELWVPLTDSGDSTAGATAALLSSIPAWLAPYFDENPRLSEFLSAQELNVRRVDGWLMLELSE